MKVWFLSPRTWKTVYFSANNYVKKKKKNKTKTKSTKYLQLFKASVTEEGEWKDLILLPFNGDYFSSGHPVLNKDDSKLYFVSDRPESIGRTDIFVVDVYDDGTYSEPRNLGAEINTKEREMFPFIGTDNVLYFSSDGYPGHGELDVYASKIFDSTVSVPINLEEPVNSKFDDFAYIINDEKHRGYFSSNRGGGHGDDDIYSFIASPPIYIECEQAISGVVRDIETQDIVPDVVIMLFDDKGEKLRSFISSKEEGAFDFQQPCNATYTIKGYLDGYLVGELDITTVNDLNAEPIEITLELMSDSNKEDEVIADQNTDLDGSTMSPVSDTQTPVSKSEETMIVAANKIEQDAVVSGVESDVNTGTPVQTNDAKTANNSEAIAAPVMVMAADSKDQDAEVKATKETEAVVSGVDSDVNTGTPTQTNDAKTANTSAALAAPVMVMAADSKGEEAEVKATKESEAVVANTSSQEPQNESVETEVAENSISQQSTEDSEETIATAAIATVMVTAADNEDQTAEVKVLESKTKPVGETAVVHDEVESQTNSEYTNSKSEDTKSNSEYTKSNSEYAYSDSEFNEVSEQSSEAKGEAEAQKAIAMNMSETEGNGTVTTGDFESTKDADQMIQINTIYFDYDKFNIRFDAKIELEKIAVVLKENPDTKIKVNAHTDIRGKKAYNLKLSKNRAYQTVQYLLDKGIDVDRISSEGHGETQVAEVCTKAKPCSGLQHQLNRRSEFLIVDKFSDAIVAQSINKLASGTYAVNDKVSNSGAYLNYDFSNGSKVYTVQVGAFKGKVQTDKYSQLTDLFNYKYDDGLNRYYAGIFETSSEARSYLRKMKTQGFKDAFVVGLKGKDRF